MGHAAVATIRMCTQIVAAVSLAVSLVACATIDEATLDQSLDCVNCCATTTCACGQSLPLVVSELGELCALTIGCCVASPVIAAGSAGCVLGVCTRCSEGPDESSDGEVAREEIPARTRVARGDDAPEASSTTTAAEMEY